MLTVKHIEKNGDEYLFTAREVMHCPRGKLALEQGLQESASSMPFVRFYGVPGPDEGARKDGVLDLEDGRVYIMNESGKTVGNYILG